MHSLPCRFCRTPVEPGADFCPRCGGSLPHPVSVDAPPTPDRADVPAADELGLHPMSEFKLMVMSIVTLGLYEIWWFYRNWRLRRDVAGREVWPAARALFSPLFAYSMFEDVRGEARRTGVAPAWSSGLRAAAFFVLNAVWRLPDPYWLATMAAFIPLLDVQATINQANQRLERPLPVDRTFSAWNWFGIVAGGILWVLVLLGTLVPIEPVP